MTCRCGYEGFYEIDWVVLKVASPFDQTVRDLDGRPILLTMVSDQYIFACPQCGLVYFPVPGNRL